MRRRSGTALIVAIAGIGGCTTGVEPGGCGSDFHVAVDGGATIRFEWDSDCGDTGVPGSYRDRPLSPGVP